MLQRFENWIWPNLNWIIPMLFTITFSMVNIIFACINAHNAKGQKKVQQESLRISLMQKRLDIYYTERDMLECLFNKKRPSKELMNRFCHASQEACLLFDESIVKRFGRIAYLNEQLNYDPNALHIYWNFINNEFEDSSINHKKLDYKELDELRAEAFSFYIKGMDEYKKYIDFSTVGYTKKI